ncbi:ATP-binding protein [Chloroflexi bacterium TSY]|nr:ATP-binding protein [Chloroflexi bacterium TSY]
MHDSARSDSHAPRAQGAKQNRHRYPFTALVGQEQMQLALLLNAINPAIGGVLIRGEKGTAKSTAARALAGLLPADEAGALQIEVHNATGVEQCEIPVAFDASPFVELPLGATDDRISGTLDIEAALQAGQLSFEPGLLARAHGGLLYVDEVNLLADHLVDLLLDAAASGINTVEREGVSVSHPARFILVGTMNPEEGELRPQLLDRFGLAVDVTGPTDVVQRTEVVRRRIAYEADPLTFAVQYAELEADLAERINRARLLLPRVTVADEMLALISHVCVGSGVDGLRADITMYKTASTLAAWEARTHVTIEDIRRAAELALPHRRRRQPFEEPGLDQQQLEDLIQQHTPPQYSQERQSRERNEENQQPTEEGE